MYYGDAYNHHVCQFSATLAALKHLASISLIVTTDRHHS